LPAHAHCDALSFEWSLDGERIVVDTGVDRYEAGPERDFQRSTAAHSTLRAGGREQGEPFGSFRLGRRPRVEGARTADGGVRGTHDGFGPESIHERTIHHPGPACLIWTDRVLGGEELPVEVRLGLAPGADVTLAADRVVIRTPRGARLGLDLPAGGEARLEPGIACQGFGAAQARPVVVWRGLGGRGRPHRFELRRAP
jgi:hypothetical protein